MAITAQVLTLETGQAPAPAALAVGRLTLTNFRCYAFQRIDSDGRSVILTGPNGAGKTNVLEALSFLTPGRGLRRAKAEELTRGGNGQASWGVAAKIKTPEGEVEIGTGRDPEAQRNGRERRLVRIDGQPARGQVELAEHMSAVWLTPQMDRLFLEGASARRSFLDRLIYGFDPAHAGRVGAWEKAARERNKLLGDGNRDASWLGALEGTMAEKGVAVAAARLDMATRLDAACQRAEGPFPRAKVAINGTVEGWLAEGRPALEAEERLRGILAGSREEDARSGSASDGPNRTDMAVTHVAKDMPAGLCSTGEQKALLIAIVLADARLQAAERGAAPVLLLDEVAAHLDEERREALFHEIEVLGGQAWLTGTDETVFAPLLGRAKFLRVEDAVVSDAAL